MKSSTVLVLCAICALLLMGAFFNGWFKPAAPAELILPEWTVSPQAVKRFSIRNAQKTWTFYRENDEWKTDSLRLDPSVVDSFLYRLSSLHFKQQVTDKLEEHAAYGFRDSALTRLTLEGDFGEKQLSFVQRNQSQLVRIEENAQLFELSSTITFPESPLEWKNRFLFQLDPNQVTHVEIKSLDERFSLSFEDNEWVLDKANQVVLADSVMVMDWLKRFAPLAADGFTTAIAPETINRHSPFTIDFFNQRIPLGTLFLRKQGGKMFGVFENGREVFYFTETTANQLFPLAEWFMETTAEGGFIQEDANPNP